MQKLQRAILYWRLLVFLMVGKTLVTGALSISQVLNGKVWSEFDPSQKFVAVVTTIGVMWGVIDAFLDTTLSDLRKRWNKDDDLPPIIPNAS